MRALLAGNPLLELFLVAGLGHLLGQVRVAGFRLGVAGVLFVGLAVGAVDPAFRLPEFVYTFGLALFAYTIGLASGPGFFAALRRRGLRDNLLVVAVLVGAAGLAVGAHALLGMKATLTAGLFTGSLTNTPALAGVLETLKATTHGAGLDRALAEPVVAYSVSYPMGVIGMLLALWLLQRRWRVDYRAEARALHDPQAGSEPLVGVTARVTVADPPAPGRLAREHHVTFGRLRRGEQLSVVTERTRLQPGDLVAVIGTGPDADAVVGQLGEPAAERLDLDRRQLDFRRMFVSSRKVAGRTLASLELGERYGASVTRVRRGDVDLVPDGRTTLELGDRVRVVAPVERMPALARLFGDSYRTLSEIDVTTFSLGIALGLALGAVPIPFPGGAFKLGFAGGPLVVALVLGARGRTGPLLWHLPYSAGLTLRQLGAVLFLAGIGTRSGYAFASTFRHGGVEILLAGAVITVTAALATLLVGRKLLHMPMGVLAGVLAGLQTQPALLTFASEQSGDDLPSLGYATVYPVAMLSKLLLAQLLLALLR